MIFRSKWTKLNYTLNLVRCFLLHSTKFQYFFYGFKSQLSNSYDNWYVQKYLKGIFHKGMLLIWKEYFMRAILSFSSPRCAIITRLNVIYTKFRCAMIAQLNKIRCVWVCVRAIAHHSRPGLNVLLCYTVQDIFQDSILRVVQPITALFFFKVGLRKFVLASELFVLRQALF